MSFLSGFKRALPYIGGGLALSSLIGLSFMGNSRSANDYSSLANPVVSPTQVPDSPDLVPVDNYGGAKDTMISSLTGVANRENRWGTVPKVYGKKVKLYPLQACIPTPGVAGVTQTLSGIFECGPGELAFEQPQIAGRPLSEFPTVSLEYQYGKAGDAPFTLHSNLGATVSPGTPLPNPPLTRVSKLAGRECNRVGILITFPNGLYSRNAQTGALEPRSVMFSISGVDSATGAGLFGAYNALEVTGQQVTPKFAYIEYSFPRCLPRVEILRYAPDDSTSPDIVDAAEWTQLIAYDSGPLFYDHYNSQGQLVRMARIAYRATSAENLNGTMGEFSILATSKLPIWDGSTWSAPTETANPAWIICDILRSAANYNPMVDAQIDLPRMLEFAQWCDSKGFEYNKVVEGDQDVYTLCQEVANAGRAVFFMRDGKASVLIDKPVSTIAQHFSPRNIIFQSFSSKFSFVEPPDYLDVTWVNPGVDWQQDSYQVYDDGKVKGTHFKRDASLALPGVTKSDQVYKLARYFQAVNRLRTGFYQFSADIENLRCEIGDRIRVTHDRLGWGLGSGRITAVSTDGGGNVTGVTLDAAQTMDAASRFSARVRLANGDTVVREVTAINGTTKTLTFTTSIPTGGTLPAVGDLVLFGELDNESRDLLITGIELAPDLSATIYAVDYAPQVYDADAGAIPPFVSVISRPRTIERTPAAPVILYAQSGESVLDSDIDGSLRTRILLTLQAALVTVTDYEYEVAPAGSEAWSPTRRVAATGGSLSVYEVEDGKRYDVRLRARAGNWVSLDWTYLRDHFVVGKTTKPPSVTTVYRLPNSNTIGWPEIDRPRDFLAYQIRAALGDNENYDQATILCAGTNTNQFDLGAHARGLKTIFVKAVDTAGNQSETAAILKTDFGDISQQNVEWTFAHHPTFPSNKTNCTVDAGELKADDDGANFYSSDDNANIYSNNDEDDFYTVMYKEATYEDSFTPPPELTPPYRWYMQSNISASGHRIEYLALSDSNFYSDTPGAGDEPFYESDDNANMYVDETSTWLPFPTNGIELNGVRTIPWRIVLFGGVHQGRIIELTHVLDLPDKVVYFNDFIVGDTGSRLPTTTEFSRVDYISLTLQDAAGKLSSYSEKASPLGPLVKVFDRATGAGVAGIVDAEVRGIA